MLKGKENEICLRLPLKRSRSMPHGNLHELQTCPDYFCVHIASWRLFCRGVAGTKYEMTRSTPRDRHGGDGKIC